MQFTHADCKANWPANTATYLFGTDVCKTERKPVKPVTHSEWKDVNFPTCFFSINEENIQLFAWPVFQSQELFQVEDSL